MGFFFAHHIASTCLLCAWLGSCNQAAALCNQPPRSQSKLFLAKTKETFKFADLQWLQAQLDAERRHDIFQCERLVLDAATGSTLLLLEMQDDFSTNLPPSSLARCEWMAELLAQSTDASSLVQVMRDNGGIPLPNCTGFTLDYLRMTPIVKQPPKQHPKYYNSKTLLCAVAQQIQAPAVLDPTTASDRLILVETIQQQGIFLGRSVLWRGSQVEWQPPPRWAQRPYQYSSAIHPTVAEIAVEIMLDLLLLPTSNALSSSRSIRLLDPTCGSGTFLAYALACRPDMVVEGWDVNPRCVEGTKANLQFALGDEDASDCQVKCRDSSLPLIAAQEEERFDCLVANLPWGKNTVDYVNQNTKILQAVRTNLNDGAPCVLVHKSKVLSSPRQLRALGYEWIGEAFVPPLGFCLPKSRKKTPNPEDDTEDKDQSQEKRNSQRITVARTIAQ